MHDSNSTDTPIHKQTKFSKNVCLMNNEVIRKMEGKPYAQAVGCVMYAMLCIRLDLCFTISLASRFQSNPRKAYWSTVKRILRYIKGTKGYKLIYQNTNDILKVPSCSDADFLG